MADAVLLSPTTEREQLGPNLFKLTVYSNPIAFHDGEMLRRIDSGFVDSGDGAKPHEVVDAPLPVKIGDDGSRIMFPLREDMSRSISIGAPHVLGIDGWEPVGLAAPQRSENGLTWLNKDMSVRIVMGGHYVKQNITLNGGWTPPDDKFAFPLDLQGFDLVDDTLLADSLPVATLSSPHVEDEDNPSDIRKIAWEVVSDGRQNYIVYTLPSLTGMRLPVVDPTLTIQPDGTAGVDTFIDNYVDFVDTNFGTNASLFIGDSGPGGERTRSLLKFDLSSLPSSALITSATLSLFASSDFSSNARTFRVYRVKRAWTETGATWNKWDASNNWSTAGGFHEDDTEQTDIGSRAFTATETLNEFKDFVLTPTNKADLDLGNGWMIKADTESSDMYLFRSSDHGTADERPRLVIIYQVAIVAPRVDRTKQIFAAALSNLNTIAPARLDRTKQIFSATMTSSYGIIAPRVDRIKQIFSAVVAASYGIIALRVDRAKQIFSGTLAIVIEEVPGVVDVVIDNRFEAAITREEIYGLAIELEDI